MGESVTLSVNSDLLNYLETKMLYDLGPMNLLKRFSVCNFCTRSNASKLIRRGLQHIRFLVMAALRPKYRCMWREMMFSPDTRRFVKHAQRVEGDSNGVSGRVKLAEQHNSAR